MKDGLRNTIIGVIILVAIVIIAMFSIPGSIVGIDISENICDYIQNDTCFISSDAKFPAGDWQFPYGKVVIKEGATLNVVGSDVTINYLKLDGTLDITGEKGETTELTCSNNVCYVSRQATPGEQGGRLTINKNLEGNGLIIAEGGQGGTALKPNSASSRPGHGADGGDGGKIIIKGTVIDWNGDIQLGGGLGSIGWDSPDCAYNPGDSSFCASDGIKGQQGTLLVYGSPFPSYEETIAEETTQEAEQVIVTETVFEQETVEVATETIIQQDTTTAEKQNIFTRLWGWIKTLFT